ncbi:BZ3500_MvSof-1268-A1-R1_Chr3-2g06356 [Microbotryum saponariae]|uniref:BZ3500_MvSof-1268-A1-R1_Chr3-2g06356 protein n=1 Tax=Microbotryum saponariae TaxID=289078 RepID=A0A2X0NGU0_9BASI|nr:BZ3500_MvSof-1268-A1-R1_Chr3-2g06356 [Microbotryum saponariae]SDA04327.1 BZ3501_MvSof-1269-A2-R1_Chr3-2g06047 [Microbotryum saponariae]
MAFGFPSKKGVRTGMRQNNGAKRNTVKLRPPPAKAPTASSSRPAAGDDDNRTPYYQRDSTHQQCDPGDDQGDEEEFTYQDQLRGEKRPLEGATVTVSGCGADKRMLMTVAAELGAKDCTSLTSQTTHLIADGFGSAKCDMALKCNMKIMDPKWLLAVRDAWRDAENVDFAELEKKHRLPALTGTVVTLTQFPPGRSFAAPFSTLELSLEALTQLLHRPIGARESELMTILEGAGAEITKRLNRRTTHLMVSSTSSGHLPHTSKLEFATSDRGRTELPKMIIVWEGWLEDAIRRGGRTVARDIKWKYEPGAEAPIMLDDDDIDPIASTSRGRTRNVSTVPPTSQFHTSRSHWGPSSMAGGADQGTTAKKTGEETDDGNTVVIRKKKSRIDNDPLLGPMAIKLRTQGSSIRPGSGAMNRDEQAYGELVAPHEMARQPLRGGGSEATVDGPDERPSEQVTSATNDDNPYALGRDRGGSIIKALSSTRSRRFDEVEPSRPRTALVSKRSMEGHTPNPLAADDSAFFEGNEEVQMGAENEHGEELSDPPIFEGLTFSLMDMQDKNRGIIKRAVEERRGKVLIDRIEPTTDHIVVDFFGAPREYLGPDADPRVITGCWIESCIHEDRLVPFDDRLLERPLPYEIPIQGADQLRIHLSGFSDIGKIHTKRFLKEIGAGTSKVFNRSCTHLIHVDAGKEVGGPGGLKIDKAREWGIPIEGPDWLRSWAAQRGVIPSASSAESATSGTTRDKKGKGKATVAPRDITNESQPRLARSRTTPHVDTTVADENQAITSGALSGCVIFVSNKLASVEKKKVIGSVTKLGATVATSFDPFAATHLVYASNRSNDPSSEYKKAKAAQTCIVHPQWAVECELLDERVNEQEYPHTFDPKRGGQLAIVAISSPAKSQERAQLVASPGGRRASRPPNSQALWMERSNSSPNKPATPKRHNVDMDDSFGPLAAAQPVHSVCADEPSSPRLSQAAVEAGAGARVESRSSSDPAPLPAGEDESFQETGRKKSGSTQHFDELTRTTSELLAHFADLGGELANPARALSRKRSHVSNASTKSSMSMSRDGSKSSEVPRKVPGQAMFEPSQFTQAGEDTYAVEYDDPAEVAARAALAFALGGGRDPTTTTETIEAAPVNQGSEDKELYMRTSTRSSARKRKIDNDLTEEESFEFGKVGKRTRGAR